MSQRLTPDGGQKGFAVGRGLLAAAETLNYNMGESNPDPYSSTSQHIGGMVGLGGGDRQDHGSQLPSRVGSHLSNTMKLFASLGLSPADLDALAQIPEENISVETLPHLIMQLKNRKNLSGDLPSLFSETSYREGRDDWGDMQGGRLDRSSAHSQSRTSQGSFGYSSMQDVSAHGYDMLEYGNSSRDRQHSDLSSDRYYGLSSSSTSDDRFMQRRMGAPSQGKIQDFLGVMPQMFPHVCALCDFDVHSTMEWNQHTTGMRHAENRRVLLQLYPDWDPQMPSGRMSESFSFESRGRSDGLLAEYPSGGVRQRTGMSSNWESNSSMGMAGKTQSYSMTPKVRSRVVVVKYDQKPVLSNLFALTRQFGTIRQHLVLKNKAFLELQTHEEALAMSDYYHKKPAILHGKQVHVYISKELLVIEKDDRADRDRDNKNVKTGNSPVVFFSNLPREREKKMELLTIAGRFGTVEKHLFLNDEAFVQMSSAGDADMLVKYFRINPLTIDRRSIRLNICTKYKDLKVPSENEGQGKKGRDEGSRKSSSKASHKTSSSSPKTTRSKSKDRSSEKAGETESEKEHKDVIAEGSGNEDEGVVEGHDENEGPAAEKSQSKEAAEDQTKAEASLNYEDSVMEPAVDDDTPNAESTEMPEEAEAQPEEPAETEADQNPTEEHKDTDDQDDVEQAEADHENAPENLSELEGLEESDFPDNMDEFVTLDELAEEEDAEMHESKSRDKSSSGRSKRSGGLRVVNVVGFRRGYNYLDEILSLAKPFGTVVRHLVLNVRPEAFVELASEEEARAMVRFYNGNVTPTVCGKEVKIFHSHVYATIQYGRVVYIGRLPPFKSDASLLKIAEPFGKIRCYYINKVRNECFIEMERAEDAERLVETAKTSTIKFEGKKLVVYLSRKYKHLEKGLRPPAPEPEEKRPPKRERSEELSEAQVSSPVKTKTSKKEEPPTKKVKEETSCTEDTQDGPAEKQAETSESEAEMKIQKTEENSSDAGEAYNFKTTPTCENDNSAAAAAAALPCVVPEKSQENNEAPTLPAQSQKKTITTLDTLGPYEPDVPVGVEFVKMGYYCRVCFLFYSNEDTAKKVHCSSQAHYDKLKKHLAKEKAKAQSDEEKN
ncbi:matrin 3-like 1.2 [Astyanax mexicanus]|uniref:matrin 3-like 1.2 n=1 Tax=Astyanax mexicanus TaxID=7994 RepID=UPI0020CAB4B5|nr:matrin 3-like 1.2 [Astyanax mexicanus]